MPAKSPAALERKRQQRKARRAKKIVKLQPSDWPMYKISARRMLPKLPDITKSELRAMLAQAVQNTAAT